MFFKTRNEIRGAHVHVDVFAGKDEDHLALTGRLVLRPEEAAALENILTAYTLKQLEGVTVLEEF